jgi:small conductance mechanosensitive channel
MEDNGIAAGTSVLKCIVSFDLSSTSFLGMSVTVWAVVIAVAIVVLGWYIFYRKVAQWMLTRGAAPLAVRSIRIVISLITFALIGAVFFIIFGPINFASSLTLSAIIALAFTLALQTTIANFIAGVMLIHDRMLRLNDDIQIIGISGKVVRVGLVTTWLRLDDGRIASVSNATLLSGPMVNGSASARLKRVL